MTETSAEDGRLDALPAPVAYDPAGNAAAPIGLDAATVVLLLAGAEDRRWAAASAVKLSGEWAKAGRRVVLADLHLEEPILHKVTGTDNLEGLVDVLLYGASVSRSTRPVPGQGFFLIPAGTYEPDARTIYGHPRWEKLVAGFRDAGASLVLFAPADATALGTIGDRLILLGQPGTDESVEAFRAAGVAPDALLLPPARGAAPDRERVVPPPDAAARHQREMMIPPPPQRDNGTPRSVLPLLLTVLAAVVLMALGGYVLARERPDLVPWAQRAGEPPPATQAAGVRSGVSRTGSPLPYSVTGWAFLSLDDAADHLDAQRETFASVPVFISPEEGRGVLQYKIFAGAVADTSAAARLRELLVERRVLGASELITQFAPLAFDLGEVESEAAARERVDSLAALGVPAYPLPVAYSDGTRRWQLYGGAYRDSTSAEAMRRILTSAGLPTRIVARIGEPGSAGR
jgi:hypothetical protein